MMSPRRTSQSRARSLAAGSALLAMRLLGLSANVMSLGGIAIAIGAMIDAAIGMVENLHKRLERNDAPGTPDRLTRWQVVSESAGCGSCGCCTTT